MKEVVRINKHGKTSNVMALYGKNGSLKRIVKIEWHSA